jgi:dinuclear metal center YbgI/SA1388 family protein
VRVLRVRDVTAVVAELSPAGWAADWDNVGLLVGSPDAPARRCLVALDCDGGTLALAERLGADLIVCHHPVVFRPLRRLDPGNAAVRAARLGIAVYAAHTNLDVAPGGVSDVLAGLLGVENAEPLQVTGREALFKLVTFVPGGQVEAVAAALADAGAGRMGNYDSCSFRSEGTGTFRPLPGASPFLGRVGELERVDEVRLEALVPEGARDAAVSALLRAHPYEEVAYDVIPLANAGAARGFGRIGSLRDALPLARFARLVGERLGCSPVLRWAGEPRKPVRRVAVCGGAGADLIGDALAAGADALVTGDVKYHEARRAEEAGLGVVDAGHFATEAPAVAALAARLRERLGDGIDVAEDPRAADVWRGV